MPLDIEAVTAEILAWFPRSSCSKTGLVQNVQCISVLNGFLGIEHVELTERSTRSLLITVDCCLRSLYSNGSSIGSACFSSSSVIYRIIHIICGSLA